MKVIVVLLARVYTHDRGVVENRIVQAGYDRRLAPPQINKRVTTPPVLCDDPHMTYRLAIFDFDGTLADSFPFFLSVFNTIADRHGFRRIATDQGPEHIERLRH